MDYSEARERLLEAELLYCRTFGKEPPEPFGIGVHKKLEVVEAALKAGKPIPRNFDWYGHLPPGVAV